MNQYVSTLNIEHGTLSNYSYDADENLLSDGMRSFTWDVRNRLVSVVNGTKTVDYKYDHDDLRVEKTLNAQSSTIKVSYYYDGSLPLAEKDDGKMKQIYINDGEGILGFVRYIYNDSGVFSHYQRLYYLYDSLGSVSYITGENGLPLQNYTYSPYETCLNVTDDPINNLQFVGRYGGYKDNDSGLTYFWHRWYDSYDGRWVSREIERENMQFVYVSAECIKFNKIYQEISNVYLYLLNAPQVNTDITGLFTTARCVPKDFQIRTAYLAVRNICFGLWGIPPMPMDIGTYSPSVPGLVGRLYNCGQKPNETKYLDCLRGACLQFCGRGADCKF